jgi:hypothetical protein
MPCGRIYIPEIRIMSEQPPSPKPSFREFTDTKGVHWRIWQVTPSDSTLETLSTTPQGVPSSSVRTERIARDEARRREWTQGWLLFESPDEKRRLFPIPDGWTTASIVALQAMCDSAKRVR